MSTAQKWIYRHFKELVDQYAGNYAAVTDNGIISAGRSSKTVEDEARKKSPKKSYPSS